MTTATQPLSASLENYLETILLLIRAHTVARSRDIAARLNVNRASVTGALRGLSERGLVNHEPYGYVTLTDQGAEIAQKVLRRHEVLRDFFVKVLAIDRAEADEAACRMEHGISKPIVDRLVDFAKFVETCPRAGSKWIRGFAHQCAGAPESAMDCKSCIEACLRDIWEPQGKEGAPPMTPFKMNELQPGEKGRIEQVRGVGAIKRRLADMGAVKGCVVEVVRVAPLGDPIDIKIKGYHLSLRKAEAANITVMKLG